jgi:hypothetical protein
MVFAHASPANQNAQLSYPPFMENDDGKGPNAVEKLKSRVEEH